MGHTDNFLKRSRHQPTTMNVNTSYHCESPKSDRKFTSLIALSNGSTTFDTLATDDSHNRDHSITDVLKTGDETIPDEDHSHCSNNSQAIDDDAVRTDAVSDAHCKEQLNAMHVKESDVNSNFFPLLMLIGVPATALTFFYLRHKKNRQDHGSPRQPTKKEVDQKENTNKNQSIPQDDGSAKQTDKLETIKEEGRKHFLAKQYEMALNCFSKAIELEPNEKTHYSNRCAAYTGLERYEAAIADAEKCTQLDKNWPKGWARLGTAAYYKACGAVGEDKKNFFLKAKNAFEENQETKEKYMTYIKNCEEFIQIEEAKETKLEGGEDQGKPEEEDQHKTATVKNDAKAAPKKTENTENTEKTETTETKTGMTLRTKAVRFATAVICSSALLSCASYLVRYIPTCDGEPASWGNSPVCKTNGTLH